MQGLLRASQRHAEERGGENDEDPFSIQCATLKSRNAAAQPGHCWTAKICCRFACPDLQDEDDLSLSPFGFNCPQATAEVTTATPQS